MPTADSVLALHSLAMVGQHEGAPADPGSAAVAAMNWLAVAKLWLAVRPIHRIKQRRKAKRAARRREAEGAATEGQFQLDEDETTMNLRTSTGAGLAGIAVNIIIQLMQMVPATADLAQDPSFAAGLTAVVMWAVARKWKTPETPGKV